MRRAFISGVTGQDGAYLTALLLQKNYRVFGGYRRVSSQNFWRLKELDAFDHPNLTLLEHDLTDLGSNIHALADAQPDEIYNLGGQSFVAVSFREPDLTASISGLGALRMMEAARIVCPNARFYQASSAEMFGKVQTVPQTERTPFYPRSPYGIAKLFAHWTAINFRESHGMYVSTGILFNHESPLRGPEFVTRRIAQGVAKIAAGQQRVLKLGNLHARRDWGFAGEYVEGMWRILQAPDPDDFILATGRTTTVRTFAECAFRASGRDVRWEGEGVDEVGVCTASGDLLVEVDRALFRPAEVDALLGDATKAHERLGWTARTSVEQLSEMMVQVELRRQQVPQNPTNDAVEALMPQALV